MTVTESVDLGKRFVYRARMRHRLTVTRSLVLTLTRSELQEHIGLKAEGWTFQWPIPNYFEVASGGAYQPQSIQTRTRPATIEAVTSDGAVVCITLETRTYVRYRR